MIKRIVKVSERRVVFELPADYIGHEVEMLAFRIDETEPAGAIPTMKQDLLVFAGMLRDSPNFNGDLVDWQREQRNECHRRQP